jgi:CheY-like chemotaxis protein
MLTVPPQKPKPRILLIDDDPDAGELMVELLQLRGYACDFCLQADNGLRRWREQRHEIVVSDLNLQQDSGLRVARSLAVEPEKPVLIALSGRLDRGAREQSRAAGFDHHVVKPIQLDHFESLLAESSRPLGTCNT